LVHYLKNCLNSYFRTGKEQQRTRVKIDRITELLPEEITELAQQARVRISEDSSPQQRQYLAQLRLSEILTQQSKELSSLFCILLELYLGLHIYL
jgi:hypothetical protein